MNLDMTVWRVFCVANILGIALSVRYLLGIRNSVWKNSVLCMLVDAGAQIDPQHYRPHLLVVAGKHSREDEQGVLPSGKIGI